MGVLTWLVLGLIAGWLASVVMKTDSQQGMVSDIILGIVGALVGGFMMNVLGGYGITGFNLYSVLIATFGAILLIGARRVI